MRLALCCLLDFQTIALCKLAYWHQITAFKRDDLQAVPEAVIYKGLSWLTVLPYIFLCLRATTLVCRVYSTPPIVHDLHCNTTSSLFTIMEGSSIIGSELKLRYATSTGCTGEVKVEVQQLFTPSTMSVVALVSFPDGPPPETALHTGDRAILKLFDRRYPFELYEMCIKGPYNLDLEDKYIQHLLRSPPTEEEALVDWWELDNLIPADKTDMEVPAGAAESRDSLGIPGGNGVLTESQNMRLIANRCISMARSEKLVYRALRPLQEAGRIPRFYASVELLVDHVPRIPLSMPVEEFNLLRQYVQVPGCLIEYVPGFPLSAANNLPTKKEQAQAVLGSIVLVNEIGDYDVLNNDVRPENIFIQKTVVDGKTTMRPVMIDFAQARVRRKDENDEQWDELKRVEDEEGCIGQVMYKQLGLGEWKYPGPGTARYIKKEH